MQARGAQAAAAEGRDMTTVRTEFGSWNHVPADILRVRVAEWEFRMGGSIAGAMKSNMEVRRAALYTLATFWR
jgi:hypothetical protein